jgi:hypothetical protein
VISNASAGLQKQQSPEQDCSEKKCPVNLDGHEMATSFQGQHNAELMSM